MYELAAGNARVEALAWDPGGHALLALLERAEQHRGRWRQENSDSDEDEGGGWDAWPRDAQHGAGDFGVQWDQPGGDTALAQYRSWPSRASPSAIWG